MIASFNNSTALILSLAFVGASAAALALAIRNQRAAMRVWRERFPFIMPAMQEPPPAFDLHEMCGEPAAYINGSMARTWSYSGTSGISHLVLAGHANGAVCRQVTASVVATYLSMDVDENNLLVPGALMLRGPHDMSQLTIELPERSLFALGPILESPIDKLPVDINRFAQDTGLVELNNVNGTSYWELLAELRRPIDAYRQKSQDVLIRPKAPGNPPQTLFAPFFTLADGEPLSIDVPIELFASADLEELKAVHKQSLVLEMTADAERRKRLYEDWLHQHEQMRQQYGAIYASMSEAQRNEPMKSKGPIIIYDYNTGEFRFARPGEVQPATPKEYYEKVLPGLIAEDQAWIKRMDDLIVSINKRDAKRERQLVAINAATLIDSFLRGWPPVFLSEEESRERYKQWCAARRKGVWRHIHRDLAQRKLRIDPLLEENTIFQARVLDDETMRLTPFHVMTDQDTLTLLSPVYGMTYYVASWPRRELEFFEEADGQAGQLQPSNLERARAHVQAAAALLDRPPATPAHAERQVQQGAEELRRALAYQPIDATQQIWNAWWARFARDTGAEFAIFRGLMTGIAADFSENYEAAAADLRQFVEHYPHLLPDPYLLLSLQAQRKKQGVYPLIEQKRDLIRKYDQMAEAYNRDAERMQAYKDLVNRVNRHQYLNAADQQRVGQLETLAQGLEQLNKTLEQIEGELKALEVHRAERERKVWAALAAEPSSDMDKAREIDATHVGRVLESGKFEFSPRYYQRYFLLHQMFQADEYISIAEALNKAFSELQQKKLTLNQLRAAIDKTLVVKYLEPTNLSELQAFKRQIDQIWGMDSIMREMMLSKELGSHAQAALQRGLKIYELATPRFPEFVEPFRQMIGLIARYRTQYRPAIEKLIAARVALRNVSLQGCFEICDESDFEPRAVWYDSAQGSIMGRDPARGVVALARAVDLSAEEQAHVECVLVAEDFIERLWLGDTAAERLLNAEIEPAPQAQRWTQAIMLLQQELIKMMAYADCMPLPDQPPPSRSVLKAFEGRPALVGVFADLAVVQPEFLGEIGADPRDVLIEDL